MHRIVRCFAALAPLTSLAAQAQFHHLPKRHLPTHRGGVVEMLWADIDRDGDDDLFVVGQIDRLFLREGPGRFVVAPNPLPFNGSIRHAAAALGDIDGDLDLDLVIARSNSWNFVYQNDGAATFTDVSARAMPRQIEDSSSVALADVDGDGDLDAIFGNVHGPDRLLRNDGTGTFAEDSAGNLTAGGDTLALAAFDADGDGDPDLVRASPTATTLDLNDGGGRFRSAPIGSLPQDGGTTVALAAGDIDGDGDIDLAIGKAGRASRVFVNDGAGRFGDASARLPAGLPDPTDLELLDLDADRDLDIAWTSAQGTVLLRNDLAGFTDVSDRLPPVDGAAWGVSAHDADGDGDPELFVASGSLMLYLDHDAGARFVDGSDAKIALVSGPSALADVDGDDDLDLVSPPRSGSDARARLYINDGTGGFVDESAARWPSGGNLLGTPAYGLALGDVDGDGDVDIALGQFQGQNKLFLNDGAGNFTDATAARVPPDTDSTTAIAFADVDGDGDLDLAIGNSLQQNRLYRNDGSGRFTDVTSGSLPAQAELTNGVAFADVDGDGDADLLVSDRRRQVGAQVRLYQNDGAGRFTDVTAGRMPQSGGYDGKIEVADFDADGDPDFAANGVLFVNDGSGTFADETAARLPGVVGLEPHFRDLDLDGDLDLISYEALYLNDGAGRFSDGSSRFAGSGFFGRVPRPYAIGDVDRDGDPDVVGSYALFRNLHRQIAIPLVPRIGGSLTLDVYATPGYGESVELALPLIAARALATPIRHPVFGLLHLDPATLVPLSPLLVPASGVASLQLSVPNAPALAGHALEFQAIVLHRLDPASWRFTNAESQVVIR